MKRTLCQLPSLRHTSLIMVGIASVLLASSCGRAKFQMSGALNSSLQNSDQNTGDSNAICSPQDPGAVVGPYDGLKGSIYSLGASQPRYTSSLDYIQYGTKVESDMYMGRVYLPTQSFTSGFKSGHSVLLDEAGKNLVEYFAFQLFSKIKLAPNEAEGDYQLALLSDDGSSLFEVDANGNRIPMISSEGEHATLLGCSTATVKMTAQTKLPIELTYFQGPREHIALIMMWRQIKSGDSVNDPNCGHLNVKYFDITANGSVPTSNYDALLQRGWKPLSTSNFELTSGRNPCATKN